jgi:hypothetical protein
MGMRTILVTGDAKSTAYEMAKTFKVDRVFAELLPSQKADCVENVQPMTDTIVEQLNSEIERLTRARDLLLGGGVRGRKRPFRQRRPMSAATKAKIPAAAKKRWAERKKK